MEDKIKCIKRLIKKTKDCVKIYENETRWIKIKNNDEKTKHINLWESVDNNGTYLLKCQAILKNCDPLKILKLNNDNNFETRKQWEGCELINIEQIERWVKENINIIRYHINIPAPFVWDREFLGFQIFDYNKKHKTHRLVHKTFGYEDKHPCDTTKYVAGSCQTMLFIKEYGNDQLVTIYTDVQPNGWIPEYILPLWKEKLRARMFLYETVAKSDSFNEIYKNWICNSCDAVFLTKPYNDVCRHCRRYANVTEI